jgi:uncharacterized membrane protein YkoI
MKAYQLLLLGYLLLSPLHSAMAAGQENPPQNNLFRNNAQEQEEPQTRISRREASDIARASYGGKVISIRPDGQFWRVRMDIGGTVTDVLVNAETGAASRPSE